MSDTSGVTCLPHHSALRLVIEGREWSVAGPDVSESNSRPLLEDRLGQPYLTCHYEAFFSLLWCIPDVD